MLRSFNFKYWISCLPYNCLKSLSSLATGIKENKLLGSSEKKCRNTNTILYMTLTKKGNSSNKKTSNFHETIQFKVNTYVMEFQVFIRVSTVNIFVTV